MADNENKDNQYVAGKMEKILDHEPETDVGYTKNNMFNRPGAASGSEYPIAHGPRYLQSNGIGIGDIGYSATETPEQRAKHAIIKAAQDHRLGDHRNIYNNSLVNYDKDGNPIFGQKVETYRDEKGNVTRTPEFFIKDRLDHFTRDVPQGVGGTTRNLTTRNPDPGTEPFENQDVTVTRTGYVGSKQTELGVFSGSTTNVNALNKPIAAEILKAGTYGEYEDKRVAKLSKSASPPISADYNAYRMNKQNNEDVADVSLFNAYNRTRIPIADQEWRKGFRYLFFTRPECYLMYREGTQMGLCNQAFYDEDFSSAYTRMPHIIKLLSPWYVTGSYPTTAKNLEELLSESNETDSANWNFLFSNRVQGIGVSPLTMKMQEGVAKGIEGYTVTPAQFVDGRQGSQIDLTFTDTKNLEVFEMARLWMLYMYKRQKGIFLPPYNGYCRENSFRVNSGSGMEKLKGPLTGKQFTIMHPYDRALEYCGSLYDIVTNETGTKILYWCKYYGIYPVSVAPSLDSSNNGPITEVSTTISFKYHYRLENNNKTLVEFNHDAGLTTNLGKISAKEVTSSLPFLLRDDGSNPDGNTVMPKYLGAAGTFTGSPYIVMQQTRRDPLNAANVILTPELRFMNIPGYDLDMKLNLGITNTKIDNITNNVVAYTNLLADTKEAITSAAKTITDSIFY